MNRFIMLSVDVEDWFQVENFKPYIPFSDWPSYELRVEKNTHRLLDLFDAHCVCGGREKPRATFFMLGWLAERLPLLVREIHRRGHEVASHGYYHNLCPREEPSRLMWDLTKSKKLLEDIIGAPVTGYRAPSFSITEDILKRIEDCGYGYDSSFNSFDMNSRYGKVRLDHLEKRGIAVRVSENFRELPVSNLSVGTHVLPLGGGGYFRLIPAPVFRWGIRAILNRDQAYLFYMHPWEVDPEQPRVSQASAMSRFRHYLNLDKTFSRLRQFFYTFEDCRFVSCRQYLDAVENDRILRNAA
ncbi:polysaccharide deacetylase [Desulfonema ishimotonii]|uniref:Polysaccharide deacetylase n=1 Tax=Desulfonema ishimotonii TaxID=45657 RepID=A0A401FQI5_9BACT|nr:XrtA system polysaccharide deacetylase [Desulfonema ishimotonii]GBC59241.1 polysaccharide deacetylase [Desulfonema ishimotonii]